MNADGYQKFVGGVSRKEWHKDMLENNNLHFLFTLGQRGTYMRKENMNGNIVFLPFQS